MNLDNFDWQEELIDKIRKEQYVRDENERKYLESISSVSYYDLIDRGIDSDVQLPSLYR